MGSPLMSIRLGGRDGGCVEGLVGWILGRGDALPIEVKILRMYIDQTIRQRCMS